MSSPRVVLRPTSTKPEDAQNARARAWAYVFDCFNHRNGKEGGSTTAPDDAERRSSDGATEKYT
jgi:hypothetical protein